MNKFILFFISMTILTLLSSEAAVYKGQKIYREHCVSCHTNAQAFVAEYDKEYWTNAMKEKGAALAQSHLKNDKAKKSWDYFKSAKYSKKSKHLSQFLVEYAKGSGKVPACN